MRTTKLIVCGLALIVAAALTNARAELRLDACFSSNMVLQRDVSAKLIGWAEVGYEVTIKLGEEVVGKVVGAGKDKLWTVLLPAQKAGAIPDITVSGKNHVTLTNLLTMACYGMNDGIYASASEERAKAYYDGILKLVKDSQAQGVEKVILLTPPVFDPRPWSTRLSKEGDAPQLNRPCGKYDDVLAGYSKWIMGLKLDGVLSIDLHTPMAILLAERYRKYPGFKLSPDGIHPRPLGHLVMAQAIGEGFWGRIDEADLDAELLKGRSKG